MPARFVITINGLTYNYRLSKLIQKIEDLLINEKGDSEITVEKEIVPLQGTTDTYLSDDTEGDDDQEDGLLDGKTITDRNSEHDNSFEDPEAESLPNETPTGPNIRRQTRTDLPKPVKKFKPDVTINTQRSTGITKEGKMLTESP